MWIPGSSLLLACHYLVFRQTNFFLFRKGGNLGRSVRNKPNQLLRAVAHTLPLWRELWHTSYFLLERTDFISVIFEEISEPLLMSPRLNDDQCLNFIEMENVIWPRRPQKGLGDFFQKNKHITFQKKRWDISQLSCICFRLN